MSELDQASNGGLGLAFLLSEMRDFRKGLEARDERINGNIDGLRQDVTNLSTAVTQSQDRAAAIESDMSTLKDDVHAVRTDVDIIMSERNADKVRDESSWAGPKKVARNIILVSAALAAIGVIVTHLGPAVIAFIPTP